MVKAEFNYILHLKKIKIKYFLEREKKFKTTHYVTSLIQREFRRYVKMKAPVSEPSVRDMIKGVD